ncbi:hypothetical protein [Pelagicoccus sp. SDUM812002]|uniref:hypothetical protein n=1 Tax=Pelagicoccus sp. SDUM812002 TaxID=3041266 RepID=UPI00280C8F55|nr:hypothetical protein [Pelagicoccus sp. SDUM812002]MDQ8186242.1 hypothetical protein [Pelagicoccus sp. SDUM812002]
MSILKRTFTPDYEKFDGIRPINIYAMRFIYILMASLLAKDVWTYIFSHAQAWDPSEAMNWSIWAAFTLFAFIGIFKTVKMLPILLLEIAYKFIWLILVALPLYRTGNLSNESTHGMLFPFALVILPILAIPWGYVINTYILSRSNTIKA